MSFSDLLSSGKGPGVIGMGMALIVLLGFGLLFMFSFDETSGSAKKSIGFFIKENDKEIASMTERVAYGSQQVETIPKLKSVQDEFKQSTQKSLFLASMIEADTIKRDRLLNDIKNLTGVWQEYKDKYRAFVRGAAAGTSMESLNTADGKTYTNVFIKEVTAVGIDIRHSGGLGRIPYDLLPAELQDYYQFDKAQMLEVAEKEKKDFDNFKNAIGKAEAAAEIVAAKKRAEELKTKLEKDKARAQVMEVQIRNLEQQANRLQSDISSAENAAASARAAGRMHLNQSGPLKSALANKMAEISRMKAELTRLRASL